MYECTKQISLSNVFYFSMLVFSWWGLTEVVLASNTYVKQSFTKKKDREREGKERGEKGD